MKILKLLDSELFIGIVLGVAAGLHFGAKFEPYHTIIMFLAGVVVVKYTLDLIEKAK